MKFILLPLFLLYINGTARGQSAGSRLVIDLKTAGKPLEPVWAYFGYDEPNYTYMKDGRRLRGHLTASTSRY